MFERIKKRFAMFGWKHSVWVYSFMNVFLVFGGVALAALAFSWSGLGIAERVLLGIAGLIFEFIFFFIAIPALSLMDKLPECVIEKAEKIMKENPWTEKRLPALIKGTHVSGDTEVLKAWIEDFRTFKQREEWFSELRRQMKNIAELEKEIQELKQKLQI